MRRSLAAIYWDGVCKFKQFICNIIFKEEGRKGISELTAIRKENKGKRMLLPELVRYLNIVGEYSHSKRIIRFCPPTLLMTLKTKKP